MALTVDAGAGFGNGYAGKRRQLRVFEPLLEWGGARGVLSEDWLWDKAGIMRREINDVGIADNCEAKVGINRVKKCNRVIDRLLLFDGRSDIDDAALRVHGMAGGSQRHVVGNLP